MGDDNIYLARTIPGVFRMFPGLPNHTSAPNDIKITREGIYSITDKRTVAALVGEIGQCRALIARSECRDKPHAVDLGKLVITDATANCGGSALGFAGVFGHVNAVEIDAPTATVLKHNIDIYGYKNIEVINADYTVVMDNLVQDVIFVDPPWGGRGYNLKSCYRLTLGALSMREVILRGLRVSHVVILKLPYNYDFSEFKGINHYRKNIAKICFVFAVGDVVDSTR